jgi:pimeloyl-ACP methyl ester carboxylesterase
VTTTKRSIVFIHGMYMNGESWQPWVDRGAARGFTSIAPSWPFHEGKPTALRETIDPALGRLQFGDVVAKMKTVIDSLDERPFLIGHSVGGLVVQKLVNEGYASAAVAISSAPPQGIVSLAPEFFRANFPHVNPFAGNRPIQMTLKRFHYTFCNTMSRGASDQAFERYVVPESRNVPRSTLTKQAKIDFRVPHVPLYLLAGDSDHLIPASLVEKYAVAYAKAGHPVELRTFANRSHFICNQAGWEEVADAAFDWLEQAT